MELTHITYCAAAGPTAAPHQGFASLPCPHLCRPRQQWLPPPSCCCQGPDLLLLLLHHCLCPGRPCAGGLPAPPHCLAHWQGLWGGVGRSRRGQGEGGWWVDTGGFKEEWVGDSRRGQEGVWWVGSTGGFREGLRLGGWVGVWVGAGQGAASSVNVYSTCADNGTMCPLMPSAGNHALHVCLPSAHLLLHPHAAGRLLQLRRRR